MPMYFRLFRYHACQVRAARVHLRTRGRRWHGRGMLVLELCLLCSSLWRRCRRRLLPCRLSSGVSFDAVSRVRGPTLLAGVCVMRVCSRKFVFSSTVAVSRNRFVRLRWLAVWAPTASWCRMPRRLEGNPFLSMTWAGVTLGSTGGLIRRAFGRRRSRPTMSFWAKAG